MSPVTGQRSGAASRLAAGAVQRWWVPPLLCALVGIGMFLSSPTYAAPDAPLQIKTAWYDIHHGFPTRVEATSDSNAAFVPCYAFHPQLNAACASTAPQILPTSHTSPVINYPPPFYWAMGVGELVASSISHGLIGDGARLMGLVLCVALLFATARRLSRATEPNAVWAVYLLFFPMASFLAANANPSGYEVAAALLFTATLLAVRRRAMLAESPPPWREGLSIGIAALVLTTARPGGALWMLVIALVFWWFYRQAGRGIALVVLWVPLVPSLIVGVVWNQLHPFGGTSKDPTAAASLHDYLHQGLLALDDIFSKWPQIYGQLGWLDTIPTPLVFGVAFGLLIYFFPSLAPRREQRLLLVVVIGAVYLALAALDAQGWRLFPHWFQGRYALPLLVGLVLLAFADDSPSLRPGIGALAGGVTLLNMYMICLNFWRYDFGIRNGFPAQTTLAYFGVARTVAVYGLVVVLGVAAVALLVAEQALRGLAEVGGEVIGDAPLERSA